MSDTTPFQLEIYKLFADTEKVALLVTSLTDLLNQQFTPARFSISLNLANLVRLQSNNAANLPEKRVISIDDHFTGFIKSDMPLQDNEEIDLVVKLLQQKAKSESKTIASAVETTERILGITFHDVRNTLGSISGIAQLMELDAGDNEELLKSIQDIISIVNRFDQDSTTTMRLIRGQALQYKRNDFDMSEMCSKIIKRNSRVYQLSSIEVESNIQDNISINGDEDRVREIFTELLVNAATSLEESGGKMKVDVQKTEENVTISVEHNGDPINNGLQEYIFIPFFTTKEKGRGMGLSRILRYLNDWGGSIQYNTSSESPVKFVVQLPITL